jgi:hypothetical protein
LNVMGEEVVRGLVDAGYTVLVKPHNHSFQMAFASSGGIDWAARLGPLLQRPRGLLIRDGDSSPWLVAADVLISDHSSVAFEYLLLDRPLVRIEMPELIRRTDIPEDYVALMASASTTVRSAGDVLAAVEHALADPADRSSVRRQVAADLFYGPGGATRRAVLELYDLVELSAPALPVAEAPADYRSGVERMLVTEGEAR